MAVTTLESLVLGGIRVEAGVKSMLVREGSKQGHVQTPALSHPRHLSPSWLTDYQADSWPLFDEDAAIRAGRSVSSASVPVSSSADMAGRTIRSRWSLAEGGPCSTAACRPGFLAMTPASEANEPLARLRFSRIGADGMKQMPLKKQAFGKARLAWPMPADVMPSASTRGA